MNGSKPHFLICKYSKCANNVDVRTGGICWTRVVVVQGEGRVLAATTTSSPSNPPPQSPSIVTEHSFWHLAIGYPCCQNPMALLPCCSAGTWTSTNAPVWVVCPDVLDGGSSARMCAGCRMVTQGGGQRKVEANARRRVTLGGEHQEVEVKVAYNRLFFLFKKQLNSVA